MRQWIDLRSDTVTQPTIAMKNTMMAAKLGDDVYGDDPTVNALQEQIADWLGFEAALFLPTGTQSNLCAILAHCQRGDEYLVSQYAHCYRWEGGGAAVLGSVQPQPIEPQTDGSLALADIAAAIKPDDPHFARSRLLVLENTSSGKVLPLSYLQAATELAARHGLQSHLDGARLFNASVAQAVALNSHPLTESRRITASFDSVSVCFSKGLGAPAGSALCGTHDFINRARRIRKMVGGAMRQSGMLAAAARYALEHHIDRLTDDHRRARQLAAGLNDISELEVVPPDTNMIFVGLRHPKPAVIAEVIEYLKSHNVLVAGHDTLRFVTHLDIDDNAIEHTVHMMRRFFQHP